MKVHQTDLNEAVESNFGTNNTATPGKIIFCRHFPQIHLYFYRSHRSWAILKETAWYKQIYRIAVLSVLVGSTAVLLTTIWIWAWNFKFDREVVFEKINYILKHMITGPFMGCISVSILLFLKLGTIFDIETLLYVNDVVSRNPTDCHWFFHVLNVRGKIWTFSPNTLFSSVFGW